MKTIENMILENKPPQLPTHHTPAAKKNEKTSRQLTREEVKHGGDFSFSSFFCFSFFFSYFFNMFMLLFLKYENQKVTDLGERFKIDLYIDV